MLKGQLDLFGLPPLAENRRRHRRRRRFDPTSTDEAGRARDEALARIEANNRAWTESYYGFVARLPRTWTGSAEDIRMSARDVIGYPTHHNAWGAAASGALRRKLIRKTGRHVHMKSKISHKRSTPEYEMA